MAARRVVYGGEDLSSKRKFKNSSHDQPIDSVLASASSIPLLGSGSRGMLSFGGNKPGTSFFRSFDQEDGVDDYLDEYFNQPEKKRRLSVHQIQFLERSFEVENKLEPERKIQLAKELGLQPRQIAVWFQNRRARWKSRQLEMDYETLHTGYKNLKADFDDLLAENEKLRAEVLRLKPDGLSTDRDIENQQTCDAKQPSHTIPTDVMSEEGESKAPQMVFKSEEQSSDTITNNRGCRMMDSIHYAPEFDESDSSHNGEDELKLELLQPEYNCFPRMEDAHCNTPESSFIYGFPMEDHQAFGFWLR